MAGTGARIKQWHGITPPTPQAVTSGGQVVLAEGDSVLNLTSAGAYTLANIVFNAGLRTDTGNPVITPGRRVGLINNGSNNIVIPHTAIGTEPYGVGTITGSNVTLSGGGYAEFVQLENGYWIQV